MGVNNFTYPRKANAVSLGDINIGDLQVIQKVEKNYDSFHLYDDLETFQPIPAKKVFVSTTFNGMPFGAYFWVIPMIFNGDDKKIFRRRLNLNNDIAETGISTNKQRYIPINRPSGKKAYLHSVSWSAHDYNVAYPYYLQSEIEDWANFYLENGVADLGLWRENQFGDLYGHIVALAINSQSSYPELLQKFPNYGYSTSDFAMPFFTSNNFLRDQFFFRPNTKFNKTGVKSSFVGGLLQDIFPNGVNVTIGGHSGGGFADGMQLNHSPEAIIFSTNDDDLNQSHNSRDWVNTPNIINEIDTLIPDNINHLLLDVEGFNWFLNVTIESDEPYKRDHINFTTIVQMPLSVDVVIRYDD
jgi:hypothetical protein